MAGRRGRTACSVCEVHAESTFRVEGMDCHEEVALIERRLKHLGGLESFSADVIGGRLHVQYDAARLSAGAISSAVADTGMRAWLEHEEATREATSRSRVVLVAISAGALVAGLAAGFAGLAIPSRALALIAIVTGGVNPARRAWSALSLRTLDMNVLMSVAVLGALAIGQWSEAATVVVLFGLAQYLESRSMDRARNAIRALMDLAPAEAVVIRGQGEQCVSIEDVGIGERIRIRPGEKIPLDGVVVSGASDVNQAPITGESLPVDKAVGDDVFAGTINGRGTLDVRVTRVGRDTTLGRIIHLVESAQAQRAPAQAFVDRFAHFYTPIVIGLAVIIACVPPIAGWGLPSDWIYRALVLLVIACPCALVIATPVALVSALAASARQGVLIKGGLHLEKLAAIRGIAFDKTGTLTHGSLVVTDVVALDRVEPAEVVRLAAAVDRRSEHPIAHAIVRYGRELRVTDVPVHDFRISAGLGAEGMVEGQHVRVGNPSWLDASGIDVNGAAGAVAQLAAAGKTPVVVAANQRLLGVIGLADTARQAARDVVDLLRASDVEPAAILTGDHEGAARAIGAAVGIADVRAGLLPDAKVAAVRELRDRWGHLAMVGDGVNDAPALAAADVGIAMGAAASDAALETADVALMGDELFRLPFAIRLSRATVRTIRVNVALAIGVKLAFLLMAVTGEASLWMAILADTGTSLLVIANGLRLLRTT
jgi:Zn2+/Cd2+-exporting ATPase